MIHQISTLDREHEEILEQLEDVSHTKSEVSNIFKEVLSKFRHHLEEENESIVPLLSYLKERAYRNRFEADLIFKRAGEKFGQNFEIMIREHRIVQNLLREAQEVLKNFPDERSLNITNELYHHIELEEEFLYPAGKAAIELIKLQAKM